MSLNIDGHLLLKYICVHVYLIKSVVEDICGHILDGGTRHRDVSFYVILFDLPVVWSVIYPASSITFV